MISKYVSIPVFLLSFIFGLIFIYILGEDRKIIYKYPSPENYNNIIFKDKSEQCFQFKPVETNCPINPLAIKVVPIQS